MAAHGQPGAAYWEPSHFPGKTFSKERLNIKKKRNATLMENPSGISAMPHARPLSNNIARRTIGDKMKTDKLIKANLLWISWTPAPPYDDRAGPHWNLLPESKLFILSIKALKVQIRPPPGVKQSNNNWPLSIHLQYANFMAAPPPCQANHRLDEFDILKSMNLIILISCRSQSLSLLLSLCKFTIIMHN